MGLTNSAHFNKQLKNRKNIYGGNKVESAINGNGSEFYCNNYFYTVFTFLFLHVWQKTKESHKILKALFKDLSAVNEEISKWK